LKRKGIEKDDQMTMPNQLFVYGSLRSGFRNPAYDYLTRYFKLMGEAVVQGKFFDKGDYPVALPSEGDHYITGELYQANNSDEFQWAIAQLDDYEGLNVEPGEAPLYRRCVVDVFQDGQATKAWIYWFNRSVTGYPELAIGDILKYIQQKNKP
jgi:gamma-glutamylcyclotransferase (GGCT)/AIG2-like uncharacterized protein YtfP